MMSLGSDLKNIISCEKKICWLNSAFFHEFIPLDPDSRNQMNQDPDQTPLIYCI